MATNSLPNSGNITRVELPNGIVILIYETPHTQSVVLSGSLPGGSVFEPAEKNGLASMTSASLMLGTQNRDFHTIHSNLEDIGADLSTHSGLFKVGFNGKSLAEDLPVLVELLSDILRYPIFPVSQIERTRGERLTWLKYQLQDTRRQASRLLRERLYPMSHPYHFSPRGTLETIPKITVEDIRNFHARHYGPQGMIISIAGAVQSEEVIQLMTDHFADWQHLDQPVLPSISPVQQPQDTIREFVHVSGKTQSDIVIGVVGPSRFSEDFQAASLANSVLGQFGMMGRIGEVVRERAGLAYYAYSRLEGGMGPGAWIIAAGVNPTHIEQAITLSLTEIERMTLELVEDGDLEDNQAYYVGRLPLQLESNEGLSGALLTMETYDLGLDYLLNYREMIYKLTKDDLLEAVKRYWLPEKFVVAVAGPEI